MRRTLLVLLTLLAVPLAWAHVGPGVPGTPKHYCERLSGDTDAHDYAPAATGSLIFLPQDGNLEDCDGDGVPGDHDGHSEFAGGGAWLLACDVLCGDPSFTGYGDGALLCWGASADHAEFPTVGVVDAALGAGAPFVVAADLVDALPDHEMERCGDFETDHSMGCTGSCVVTFQAGQDGSYQVYVTGTAGHVFA